MRHLWTRKLPMLQRELEGSGSTVWIDALRQGVDAGVRVVPVVDPAHVAKSGHVIARLLEKQLRVRSRYIKSPAGASNVSAGTIIFVDDFLGGGTQFANLFARSQLLQLPNKVRLIYAPLVAYEEAVARMRQVMPRLHIVPAESLDATHRVLTTASSAFADGVNTASGAHDFYYGMIDRYGLRAMPPIDNIPHLGVTYAFEHAAPNNSLEILWQASKGWTPLFDR